MKLNPIVTDTYGFPTLIRAGSVHVDKSARTVDWVLAELIVDKVIEFRVAPKTGGYYVR